MLRTLEKRPGLVFTFLWLASPAALGVLRTSVAYRLWRWKLASPRIFSTQPEWKLAAAPVATR